MLLNGKGKQQCTLCGYRSIAGLMKGNGKCPFHWAKGNWGLNWASKCHPDHPQAIKNVNMPSTGR